MRPGFQGGTLVDREVDRRGGPFSAWPRAASRANFDPLRWGIMFSSAWFTSERFEGQRPGISVGGALASGRAIGSCFQRTAPADRDYESWSAPPSGRPGNGLQV